jgi:putative glutamine amidotransferase
MAPVVAITSYGPNAADRYELPRQYVEAVRRAGAVPVLVAPGEERLDDLLARVDGLVLSGGGDVDPRHWGGPADHPAVEYVNPERDELELHAVRFAVDHDLPTLAICRGAQVLNVALGGTLHAHVPDVVGDSVTHRREPKWDHPHEITAEPGSLVAEAMGTHHAVPASWHHQAIDQPAEGLTITARAPDGIIEAVEHAGHPWMLAVQWHPEITAAEDPTQQALFDELVDAIRLRSRQERTP